jgi:hypothetical protein
MLVVIGTDWIGICKSNYNTIKTAPYWSDILGPKKYICMFPIDPNIFYSKKEKRKKKKIGIIQKFVSVSDFNNRSLTVAILTLSDKRLIETDLLKTGFLVHLIDVWNQKHCTTCQIINKL